MIVLNEEIQTCIETIELFLDEYFELIFNPEDRIFIDLERISWFEDLNKVLETLKEVKEKIDCLK